MSTSINTGVLEEFSAFVTARTGLFFPTDKLGDLESAVTRAAPELGFNDAVTCMNGLLASPPDKERLEVLAAYLTIGETYFFRNKADFDAIENVILPALSGAGTVPEPLRIWSAGCSTGEEPYSLAMLLDSRFPALKDGATILATDINTSSLKAASRGVYGDWSFRDVPEEIRGRYFRKTADKKMALAGRIKTKVVFSYLNLAEDLYPSLLTGTNAMDLILCRNVLMYFRQDQAEAVLGRFRASLKDGGWLILGPAEGPLTFPGRIKGLCEAHLPGLTAYRKIAGARPVPLPPAAGIFPAAPQVKPAVPQNPGACHPAGTGKAAVTKPPAGPRNAGELVRLARTLADQGRLAEAGEKCAEAIAAGKPDPLAHYLLGSILLEQGRGSEAVFSFRRALYLAPDHILAHLALGSLFLREGKTAPARRHLKNAAFLLERYRPDEILPDSEGMTAGRLSELTCSTLAGCGND